MGGWIFFYLCLCVGWMIVWGIVTKKVAENKGYTHDNSFWWGFFLEFIGLIVILTRPDKRSTPTGYSSQGYSSPIYASTDESTESDMKQRWTCPKCGMVNTLSLCWKCGTAKTTGRRKEAGWICKCGAENPAYVGTCGCGLPKSSGRQINSNNKGKRKWEDIQALQASKQNGEASDSQKNSEAASPVKPAASAGSSKFDEIKAYKELLDSGIISQEEFDKKKAELLGL